MEHRSIFIYLILALFTDFLWVSFSKEISGIWRTDESDLYHFDADRFESQANLCLYSLRSLANSIVYSYKIYRQKADNVIFYFIPFLSVLLDLC